MFEIVKFQMSPTETKILWSTFKSTESESQQSTSKLNESKVSYQEISWNYISFVKAFFSLGKCVIKHQWYVLIIADMKQNDNWNFNIWKSII